MGLVASAFTGLAALLHAYIFCMESLWWRRPDVWRRFSVADQTAADTTAPMAYNQGFYNLFLGIGAALGVMLWWTGSPTVGKTLAVFCTASMVLAATVLLTSGRQYARAAVTQGTLPLVGLIAFLLA